MKQYRGAIFDVDGTLLDTLGDIGGSANLVLEKYGCPTHAISAYKNFVGHGIFMTLKRAFPADTPDEAFGDIMQAMIDFYAQHYMDTSVPYSGIHALLQDLQTKGVRIGVNSNKTHIFTVNLMEKVFPDIDFVDVIGDTERFPRKPAPDAALHIAAQMGLSPDEVLFIGDTEADIRAGHAAGMDVAACLWGFRSEEELRACNAEYYVADADELRAYF